MKHSQVYAEPLEVNDINECHFYHTVDLPGYGIIVGQWDLRGGIDEYLGNADFKGKRVLEIGTADGQLCFEMEKRGAEVVALDISKDFDWDIVPFVQYDYKGETEKRKYFTERLNKAFWFCHKLFKSKTKMVYSSAYNIPLEIGAVDIATFGAILLHLQNPFEVLRQGLRLASETVIITELLEDRYAGKPMMVFQPNFKTQSPTARWWSLSPEIIVKMIGVLGFEDTSIIYHEQKYKKLVDKEWQKKKLFTVVGRRSKGNVISVGT